jgi:hypothetical protein
MEVTFDPDAKVNGSGRVEDEKEMEAGVAGHVVLPGLDVAEGMEAEVVVVEVVEARLVVVVTSVVVGGWVVVWAAVVVAVPGRHWKYQGLSSLQ